MRSTFPVLLIVAVLPLIASCDDGPTGPTYPNIRGSYAANWSYMFDAGEFGSFELNCTGSLTVSEQSAGEFSGSYITNASSEDCESSSGSIAGEIRPDGGLNFVIDTPGEADELGALTGCSVVSADNQFNGTFQNNTIDADADATLDCETDSGVVRIVLEVEMVASKT